MGSECCQLDDTRHRISKLTLGSLHLRGHLVAWILYERNIESSKLATIVIINSKKEKTMKTSRLCILMSFVISLAFPLFSMAEEIGSVSTKFKLIGSNHKIVVEAFDDPVVKGVAAT